MGSTSNQFSLVFCLLVVGLWVIYCRSPKTITAVGIVIGLILVNLSHLIGFVVAGTVMGTYALFQEQRWKKVGILALLSLPALLLFAYDLKLGVTGASLYYSERFVWDKLRNLSFPIRLFTSRSLDVLVLAALAFLIILVWKSGRLVAMRPVWLTCRFSICSCWRSGDFSVFPVICISAWRCWCCFAWRLWSKCSMPTNPS